MTGRAPKPDDERVNRTPLAAAWTEVPNVPNRAGPRLPPRDAMGCRWHRRVLGSWAAWKAMPQAALWGAAEWDFALGTAEVAQRFYLGDTRAAAELRQREKAMGTTLDGRLALRLRYVDPAPVELAVVVAADDYRNL